MNRAVLLIGVSKAGGLPPLKAVESSIDKMVAWARSQGIPDDQIIRRTDAGGASVTVADLFKEIKALVDRDTIEQLIVYFSGHGVVNNRSEYWLLSDAPVDAAAAVNLEGNMTLARAGAFDHVVFLSDACRTPTQGVQWDRIIGSDIFPNIVDVERERSVDIFFATALGAPALEVAQTELGRQYQAMFTEALLDALNGQMPEAIVDGRVRPRPLKKALPKKVWEKLQASGLSLSTTQTPDARITSEDDAWLSEIVAAPVAAAPMPDAGVGVGAEAAPAPPAPGAPVRPPRPSPTPAGAAPPRTGAPPQPQPPAEPAESRPLSTREVAQLVVAEALHTYTYGRSATTPAEIRARTGRGVTENADRFLKSMGAASERRPQPMPDQPGFEIHGRVLANARCPDGACHTAIEGDATTVSVATPRRQSQVLLQFDDGTGVLLPVIAGFVGVLRFHQRGLDEVWYEPSDDFEASMGREEVDFLRQAVIKASSLGVFALDRRDADQLASHMQNLKFQDPALAVYAAYAYHDIGQSRRIGEMHEFLKERLGVQLYDLALLSRQLLRDATLAATLKPRVPLLSQGWALVGALRGAIPDELQILRAELQPSLWSLYSPAGVQAIHHWMDKLGTEDTITTTGAVQ